MQIYEGVKLACYNKKMTWGEGQGVGPLAGVARGSAPLRKKILYLVSSKLKISSPLPFLCLNSTPKSYTST